MITIRHDDAPSHRPGETCALCTTPTRYWYTPKGVAACQECAATHNASDVPSKLEWLIANRVDGQALLPLDWHCNTDRRAESSGAES
ncbi:hypothetical protein ACJRW5_24655 [Pseudomonas sp. SH1-B]